MAKWSVPMTREKLNELWKNCDIDGDDSVAYEEFSTVMTKALFPAKAQTGVTTTGWTTDVIDAEQGYGQVASTRVTASNVSNVSNGYLGNGQVVASTRVTASNVSNVSNGYLVNGQVASTRFGEATRVLNAKQGIKGKTGDLVGAT